MGWRSMSEAGQVLPVHWREPEIDERPRPLAPTGVRQARERQSPGQHEFAAISDTGGGRLVRTGQSPGIEPATS